MEITLSSRQTCFQRSRSTSAGRIPANSMMPAAARHSPWCMSPARRSSREHACTGRAAMRRSLMTGISTPAVGLRSAQPRRMAWEQTALRAARPFRKRRGVRKLPLSHSRQLAASSPRTCRRARSGLSRSSLPVRVRSPFKLTGRRRSFLLSSISCVAWATLTLCSISSRFFAPSRIMRRALFRAPLPPRRLPADSSACMPSMKTSAGLTFPPVSRAQTCSHGS